MVFHQSQCEVAGRPQEVFRMPCAQHESSLLALSAGCKMAAAPQPSSLPRTGRWERHPFACLPWQMEPVLVLGQARKATLCEGQSWRQAKEATGPEAGRGSEAPASPHNPRRAASFPSAYQIYLLLGYFPNQN